jgi:hypothetical protein
MEWLPWHTTVAGFKKLKYRLKVENMEKKLQIGVEK